MKRNVIKSGKTKIYGIFSIYPNIEGTTVVIPKKHLDSYAFEASDDELTQLVLKSKIVGKLLDRFFGVGRTAMILEGMGVNHLHAKLYPLKGTKNKWKPFKSNSNVFFNTYKGYISSHDGPRESDTWLSLIVQKFKNKISKDIVITNIKK